MTVALVMLYIQQATDAAYTFIATMNDKYQQEFNLPPTMMKMMEKLGIEPIDVIMRQNFLRSKINPPADEDICS